MDKILLSLFTSRVRLKILDLFLQHPGELFYVRQIVRKVEEEINAVRRELSRLLKIGLLRSERRANRLYYAVRPEFLYYPELIRMVGKSTNLGQKILEEKSRLGRLKFIVLAISFVKGRKAKGNQVDLLVVGRVNLPVLEKIIAETEKVHGYEVNYTVMPEEEFTFRKKRRDSFIRDILSQPQVVLIGDEEELNRWE